MTAAAARRALLLRFALPLVVACGPPSASLAVTLPASVAGSAAWIEVGFLAGGCPPLGALADGLPPGDAVARVAFRPGEAAPRVGLVASGKYGVAAAARDGTCRVVAVGCTSVDLSSDRSIQVSLSATSSPAGGCAAGTVCSYARCVPPSSPDDPSVGASCSLELMGAGPLGSPLATETQVGSPAVVPTQSGFLIAYREYEPLSGEARLTLHPVDNGGAAGAAQVQMLTRCAMGSESDATGLGVSGDRGLAVLARAPCMGKSGYDLFGVSASGAVGTTTSDGSGNGKTLLLSPAKAVALGAGGQYVVGARVDGAGVLLTTDGASVVVANTKLGDAADTGAWVATSSKLVAALFAGASKAPVPEGGTPEGGASSVLRLSAAPLGTALGNLPAGTELPGQWGSLAALGTRVVVVSDGDTGKPVSYRTFDLVGNALTPGPNDGFGTQSLRGKPLFADVALSQDWMLVAVEQPGAVSLVAFDHATTMPVFAREVDLGDDPRVPSLTGVRDGRLAVAASATRVAVAWATGATLGANDPVGGYAVFACR